MWFIVLNSNKNFVVTDSKRIFVETKKKQN